MEEEARLIEAAGRGSAEAFRGLLRLHQGRVRAYLSRFVRDRDAVDDLAQETFLAAYRDLGSRGDEAPFGLWLLRIARHRALTHLRDEERRRARTFEAALSRELAARMESEEPAGSDPEIAALRSCLEKLPEPSSRLVSDYYFRRRPAVEIAREQGRRESAVGMTLLRIRQTLRDCVKTRLAEAR